MKRQKLINRLKVYYPMERFHAFVTFPLLAIMFIHDNIFLDLIFFLYGMAISIFILIQGQHYWKLKLYSLTGKKFDQQKNIQYFKNCKKANLVLIVLIPVVFLIQITVNNWAVNSPKLMAWALFINVFGVLEHINYYHTQLMVDNLSDLNYLKINRRLKIASLAKDLNENKL